MAFNIPSQLVLLSSQTASSSASISFTSVITSDFTSYYLTIRNLVAATNGSTIQMLASTNNGSSYLSSNYKWVYHADTSNATQVTDNNNSSSYIQLSDAISSTTSQAYNCNINLFNLNTSYVFNFYGISINQNNSNSYVYNGSLAGGNKGTTAINALQIAMSSGNIASGVLSLYGVPNP